MSENFTAGVDFVLTHTVYLQKLARSNLLLEVFCKKSENSLTEPCTVYDMKISTPVTFLHYC